MGKASRRRWTLSFFYLFIFYLVLGYLRFIFKNFNLFFKIEIELIYSVVLGSGVRQSDSEHTHTHTHTHTHIPPPPPGGMGLADGRQTNIL